MKLLLDEMYPSLIARELRARGHDVASVHETPGRGTPDDDVLDHARSVGRAVVTENVRPPETAQVVVHCYPYSFGEVRRTPMDVAARLSSKGQLTVPKAVRAALKLEEGDQVVFRVEGERAILARTPSLLDLAGSVSVPAEKRGLRWEEVRRQTWAARARTRR